MTRSHCTELVAAPHMSRSHTVGQRPVPVIQGEIDLDVPISDLTTSIVTFAECVKGSSGSNGITSQNYITGK